MENAPVVIENTELAPLSAVQIQKQVNTIQEVMNQVMKDGTHYGKIPGCGDSKSLLKPGAEKIMATFRLAADPIVDDLSTADEIRYRIKVRITSPSGVFLGAGIGECSTNEEKYKWRASYILEEFNDTDVDRKRVKYTKYGNKPTQKVNQIRTNPADLANTVLKMAKKRALVDAVITVTAASDIFTQDIEDLPEEIRDEIVREDRPVQRNNGNQQATRETAAKELPPYPADKFEAKFPLWKGLIEGGSNTPMQIINKVCSINSMTADQKNKLTAIKKIETEGTDNGNA